MTFMNTGSAAASPERPWPADRVERWPIERLIPYANNPRPAARGELGARRAKAGRSDAPPDRQQQPARRVGL